MIDDALIYELPLSVAALPPHAAGIEHFIADGKPTLTIGSLAALRVPKRNPLSG
ncbi:hypothetical protein [Polaromonas sp. SM01]|uniref:hypothetical protein n=1 Tax=Polaromonas sp. SM01 TaxID=3085630 RepID=UPI00298261E6|nr:hypothetical protein [Polaromonas sp. SM01]MDW5444919.1 hypothetical protein [Polaromonas sp. SM01]